MSDYLKVKNIWLIGAGYMAVEYAKVTPAAVGDFVLSYDFEYTLLEAEIGVTVYFDLDKHSLRSDGKVALDVNYALLNEFPEWLEIVKCKGIIKS